MTPYLVCLLILGLLATAASGSDSASCVECHQGSAAAGQASLDTASLVGDAPALDASRFVVTALDPVASRRQLLQAHSREALVKVRTLLSEQLKMPAVDSASMRRRRLLSPAKPVYSTQCLYEEPPPPEDSGDAAGDAPPPDAPPSAPPPDTPTTSTDSTGSAAATATVRRSLQDTTSPDAPPSPDAPFSPPSPPTAPDSPPSPPETPSSPPSPPSPPAPPPTGRCYLNPAVMAHPDFPDAESPTEIMLMRTAFWSYQCMFENKKRRWARACMRTCVWLRMWCQEELVMVAHAACAIGCAGSRGRIGIPCAYSTFATHACRVRHLYAHMSRHTRAHAPYAVCTRARMYPLPRLCRCGTYLHPPYDCRWNELQERCMVGPDFLIPRFVEFLHCRDDATITPFWHRCYMIQVVRVQGGGRGRGRGLGKATGSVGSGQGSRKGVCGRCGWMCAVVVIAEVCYGSLAHSREAGAGQLQKGYKQGWCKAGWAQG